MVTRELTGDFIMYLYDNGCILENWIAAKTFIQRKFRDFLQLTNRTLNIYNNELLDQMLNQFDFVYKGMKDKSIYKFDSSAFFHYRNEMIVHRDNREIGNVKSKIFNSIIENTIGSPNVLPDLPVNEVAYQFGFRQNINISFMKSENGCYCCQINFRPGDEFLKHIEYHSMESEFKFRQENRGEQLQQHLVLSYKLCEMSSLQFSISSLYKRPDIIIEKVLLFLGGSVYFLEDTAVPYLLPMSGSAFYLNSEIFEIGYAYPIIVVFRTKNDPKGTRCIEEHNFLRFDRFPAIFNLKAKHVFKGSELQIIDKLDTYQPTPMAKALCFSGFDENLPTLKKSVRDYLKKVTPLNDSNICDIFTFLLEMEDFARTKQYEKFMQTNVKIAFCGGIIYSAKIFANSNDNQLDKNPIEIGDQIVLMPSLPKSNKQGNGGIAGNTVKFSGIIVFTYCNRIYFKSKSGRLSTDPTYDASFEPHRFDIKYRRRALEFLRNDIHMRARLFPNNAGPDMQIMLNINFFNQNIAMNPEQQLAVQNIVENRSPYVPFVIYGLPGTGKTTIIVEAVLQLWQKSPMNKIFVTASSDATCDELAIRLCYYLNRIHPGGMHLLRIYADFGKSNYSSSGNRNVLESSNLCYGQHFYPSLDTIYTYSIIVATLNVAGKLVHGKISPNHFTHVFIDDCGSTSEVEALTGIAGILSTSGYLIVAGDPKELGADIHCNHAAEFGLSRSLLERLMERPCYQMNPFTRDYLKSVQIRLYMNYRNHKDILMLPNKMLYDNELQAIGHELITGRMLEWSGLRGRKFPIIMKVVKGFMKRDAVSFYNIQEVQSVMHYIKELKFFGVKGRSITDEEIGIVSPFEMQCHLIRRELVQRGWLRIDVDTIEGFQGKEKSILIVSMVQSVLNGMEILNNIKKFNLLLTRSQSLLIVIGNAFILSKLYGWHQFIDYCRENRALIGAPKSNTGDDNESIVSESLNELSIKDDRGSQARGQQLRNQKNPKKNPNTIKKVNNGTNKVKKGKDNKSQRRQLRQGNVKKETKGKEADLLQWLDDLPNVMNIFETSILPSPHQTNLASGSGSGKYNRGSVSNLSDVTSEHSVLSENKRGKGNYRGKKQRGGFNSSQKDTNSSTTTTACMESKEAMHLARGGFSNNRGRGRGANHKNNTSQLHNMNSNPFVGVFSKDKPVAFSSTNPFLDISHAQASTSSGKIQTQPSDMVNPFLEPTIQVNPIEKTIILPPISAGSEGHRPNQQPVHAVRPVLHGIQPGPIESLENSERMTSQAFNPQSRVRGANIRRDENRSFGSQKPKSEPNCVIC